MRGVCALTGIEGEFIAAHLIPKAVTKPSIAGRPLIQIASGKKAMRRWDSWYDDALVTIDGENILTELDTWAIRAMREHRLIWGGWGNSKTLEGHYTPLPGSAWGVRRVSMDTRRLRLFFLSLLWRAAATSRPEFAEVEMPAADLERLRLMLCERNAEPASYYRTQLTQLSTRGVVHNMPPIAQYKEVKSLVPGMRHRVERIYRFYFDGLIAHLHLPETESSDTELGPMVLGADKHVVVSTVTYESSFQNENLTWVLKEALPSHLV